MFMVNAHCDSLAIDFDSILNGTKWFIKPSAVISSWILVNKLIKSQENWIRVSRLVFSWKGSGATRKTFCRFLLVTGLARISANKIGPPPSQGANFCDLQPFGFRQKTGQIGLESGTRENTTQYRTIKKMHKTWAPVPQLDNKISRLIKWCVYHRKWFYVQQPLKRDERKIFAKNLCTWKIHKNSNSLPIFVETTSIFWRFTWTRWKVHFYIRF